MRTALVLILSLALMWPVLAAPPVQQHGAVWRVSNGIIQFELDTRTGRVRVTDSRCSYTWRGAETVVQQQEMVTRQAVEEPKVDGALDDWADLPLALTCDTLGDAKEVTCNNDLSARAGLRWTPEALYLAAQVTDDTVVWPSANEGTWWEYDSVEFWVGSHQYALRPDGEGGNIWSRDGTVPGAQVAFRRTPHGYAVEARVPAAALGLKDLAPAARFAFALGVNDAEKPGAREGQEYFPKTWRHSTPETFALAVLGDAEGRVPAGPVREPAAMVRQVKPLGGDTPGLRFEAELRVEGGERVAALLQMALPKGEPELQVSFDLPDREAKLEATNVCSALALDDPQGLLVIAPYCDGLGLPLTEERWRGQGYGTAWMDMPWIGLTDGTKGYALLAEDPDDAMFRIEQVETPAGKLLAPSGWALPSKGLLHYPRRFRYFFADKGGYVALCKWYRGYLKRIGMLKTQKEKLRKKPELARLAGAPDIWGDSSLQFCREAKAAGMDRLMVNGPASKSDMEAIKALGYLISKYDNYEDTMDTSKDHYGDVKWPDDCCIEPNGEPMKAWLTFDKKEQFMKRCPQLFEQVARRWIPKDLALYPYDARFLDVTTASGLLECYSKVHPATRTEDREAKRRLAKYVGDELNLVLGGEHGRWWGVDIYNYWEGMQSGGFYSWPAGHVGTNIPQKREEIGKDYLEYGLGQQHRLPLWELCFHDCVVSTWYWGDSTGHLFTAAPELAAKQDAYNILYGTIPLYWVRQPYSFRWDDPKLRARLLESYRNTCKLHEVIGFEEMVSHEWVTPDKNVQRTKFSDGTTVTVNFGAEPYALPQGGKTYRLPEFGFYAQGPKVLLYKAVEGERATTMIRTPGYLFCDAAGQMRDFGPVKTDGKVAIRTEGERMQIVPEGARTIRLRPAQIAKGWSLGGLRALLLDDQGQPVDQVSFGVTEDAIELPGDRRVVLVTGSAAKLPDLVVTKVEVSPQAPKQGQMMQLTLHVANRGGVEASGDAYSMAVYWDATRPDRLVAEPRLTVMAGQEGKIGSSVDTTELDGTHRLIVLIDPANRLPELVKANNRSELAVTIQPDWSRWSHHADVEVQSGDVAREEWPAGLALNLAEGLPVGARLNADSVRVAELKTGQPAAMVTSQFEPSAPGSAQGEVWWLMPGTTPAGGSRQLRVLWATAGGDGFLPAATGGWDEQKQELTCPGYRVGFEEGTITKLVLTHPGAPAGSALNALCCSSGDTGWVHEANEGLEFKVLHCGPVRTVVETKKNLTKGYQYHKVYEFYPHHFLVNVEGSKSILWSRAFYAVHGQYEDDKGLKATVDGKGDGEGISGQNADPKWYTFRAEGWAQSGIAMSPFENICYWDGSGDISFTSGKLTGHRVGYIWHPAQPDASFGARDYKLLTTPLVVKRLP